MKRKGLSVIFASTLLMSTVLTGCGSSADQATEKAAETQATVASEEAAATEEVGGETTVETAAATEESTSAASAETVDGTGVTIGAVMNNASADTYMTTYYEAMINHAKEVGAELIILDPVGDGTKQANMVQDLIEKAPDVICIWPVNSETAVASAQKVQEAGIPCLAINSPLAAEGDAYIAGYVGPDNFTEGKLSGEQMVNDMNGKGNIVVIEGVPGRDNSRDRYDGMKAAIEGTEIKILDSQDGEYNHEESRAVMENYLTKYGEGEIDAVFCMDDTEALGAIDAIETAGREGIAVYAAACGDPATFDYIRDGSLSGVAIQSPIIDASTAIDYAVKAAKGEKLEAKTFMDTPVGTPDNFESLGIEEW